MGLAVCVLVTLGVKIEPKIIFLLLGSGIVCLGISLFDDKTPSDNDSTAV